MLDEIILCELNKLPKTRQEAIEQKSKYYFIGKCCRKGHLSERYTSNERCKQCVTEQYTKKEKRPIAQDILDNYKELFKLPSNAEDARNLNSKYYFTAKECKNGHIAKRITIIRKCVECYKQELKKTKNNNKFVIESRDKLLELPRSRKEAKELKSIYYFTDIPCKNNHLDKRLTISANCRSCHNKIKNIGRKRRREKIKHTIKYRINASISSSIRKSLINGKQGNSWKKLVNYTLDDLISHLEKQFKDGMNWNNYGKLNDNEFGWEIDHIKPVSLCESFQECWALENLQPLWKYDNVRKSNKYIGSPENKIEIENCNIKQIEWTDVPKMRKFEKIE